MKFNIHHDQFLLGGRDCSATMQVGLLGMSGQGKSRQDALLSLRRIADSYRAMLERAIEQIEAEMKEATS